MGSDYLQVAKAVDGESIELPTETDGTLLLTTLAAQYPGVTGLKFRNEKSGGMRGVRLADGRFYAPDKDGWGDHIYYCVLNTAEVTKRKSDSGDEEVSAKNKRFENKLNQRCTDLVVLDLPWKTTVEEMREYFEGFGDVVLAQVKKDLKTGESKGYGFIRFSTFDSQVRALGQRHFIQGRWCDVKIPKSKESQQQQQQQSNASPKIYVGRLTEDVTENDLRDYFSSFGEVTHVFIPNRPFRGFAFVTFLHGDVAQSLFGEDHVVKNTSVIVADANPKSESRKDSSRQEDSEDEESFSQEQKPFGSNRGLGGGVRVIGLAQSGSGSGSGFGTGGVAFGKGQGMMDATLGNMNLSPQLSEALVSAVLSQLTGVMQGQGQDQKQQKQQGGGRSLSTQNYGKKSFQTGKRGSEGRLRGNF